MRAIRVFFPQILLAVASTGFGMGWAAIASTSHVVLAVPVIAGTIVCGALAALTTFNKALDIDGESDWESLDWKSRECTKCQRLAGQLEAVTKDRDETRQALATLEIP